ncbi:hypothetical protein TEA_001278 [Camellia sinensis var. sinensis]|uniref:Uncharacterized protein n=1 Tax=Camellia sinensis var. sinensis TaxID=542762 RepID=A0A4S4EBN1_CAMSN|nr:hypothetical protein TEA_001278 [Camellia sinensis var. sinensis]
MQLNWFAYCIVFILQEFEENRRGRETDDSYLSWLLVCVHLFHLDLFISHSLCCALIASAAGAYLHTLWNIGGLLTTLGYLGSIVWLPSTPPYEEQQKRVSLLMVDALFEGASIAPLIELAIEIDPR